MTRSATVWVQGLDKLKEAQELADKQIKEAQALADKQIKEAQVPPPAVEPQRRLDLGDNLRLPPLRALPQESSRAH